jgi:hypothetical protein
MVRSDGDQLHQQRQIRETWTYRLKNIFIKWSVMTVYDFYSGTESIRASVWNTSATAAAATARFLISC